VVTAELRAVVQDFERLWSVAGFAEGFAANLARAGHPAPGGVYDLVLAEHHQLLVAALRRHGHLAGDLDDLADALVGFYLGRRLRRTTGPNRCQGWAGAAIETIVGARLASTATETETR
jgi:hypothetical protein